MSDIKSKRNDHLLFACIFFFWSVLFYVLLYTITLSLLQFPGLEHRTSCKCAPTPAPLCHWAERPANMFTYIWRAYKMDGMWCDRTYENSMSCSLSHHNETSFREIQVRKRQSNRKLKHPESSNTHIHNQSWVSLCQTTSFRILMHFWVITHTANKRRQLKLLTLAGSPEHYVLKFDPVNHNKKREFQKRVGKLEQQSTDGTSILNHRNQSAS